MKETFLPRKRDNAKNATKDILPFLSLSSDCKIQIWLKIQFASFILQGGMRLLSESPDKVG